MGNFFFATLTRDTFDYNIYLRSVTMYMISEYILRADRYPDVFSNISIVSINDISSYRLI